MKCKPGYLDELAASYGVFVSDLLYMPSLRKAAIRKLENIIVPKHRHLEWQSAMEYLSSAEARIA